jgi:hypothetical protein
MKVDQTRPEYCAPLDAHGRLVQLHDRVRSTAHFSREHTFVGKVVGFAHANLITVEAEEPGAMWGRTYGRSAAFLWEILTEREDHHPARTSGKKRPR